MGCEQSKAIKQNIHEKNEKILKRIYSNPLFFKILNRKRKSPNMKNSTKWDSSTNSNRTKIIYHPQDEIHYSIEDDDAYVILNTSLPPTDDDWMEVQRIIENNPQQAKYVDPVSLSTPLHLACVLLHHGSTHVILSVIKCLLERHPEASSKLDAQKNIPLHYALSISSKGPVWEVAQMLIENSSHDATESYLKRNDILPWKCSPIYRIVQINQPILLIQKIHAICPPMCGLSNADGIGDSALSLLHRRFCNKTYPKDPNYLEGKHKQLDQFEQSSHDIWKTIEILLQQSKFEDTHSTTLSQIESIIYAAIEFQSPPTLLNYILEKYRNPILTCNITASNIIQLITSNDLSPTHTHFYWKYVFDAFLKLDKAKYKAIEQTCKQMVEVDSDISKSAIFYVQKLDISIKNLTNAMWAYPNDAAIQMLSCIALKNRAKTSMDQSSQIAVMGGMDAILNAMKQCPQEGTVQSEACAALAILSRVNGIDELSMVANGAFDSVVNAMQHHLMDVIVQKEGCDALQCMLLSYVNDYFGSTGVELDQATCIKCRVAIENAMEAHPHECTVQSSACKALEACGAVHTFEQIIGHETKLLLLLDKAKRNFSHECETIADYIMDAISAVME